MKRFLAVILTLAMLCALLAGCGGGASSPSPSASAPAAPQTPEGTPESGESAELTPTQKIIAEAEGMTLEELAKKAIEESNGKMFYGVGNSSRGKSALPLFIDYLKTIDPSYSMEFEWQQPKNNKIFDQLTPTP